MKTYPRSDPGRQPLKWGSRSCILLVLFLFLPSSSLFFSFPSVVFNQVVVLTACSEQRQNLGLCKCASLTCTFYVYRTYIVQLSIVRLVMYLNIRILRSKPAGQRKGVTLPMGRQVSTLENKQNAKSPALKLWCQETVECLKLQWQGLYTVVDNNHVQAKGIQTYSKMVSHGLIVGYGNSPENWDSSTLVAQTASSWPSTGDATINGTWTNRRTFRPKLSMKLILITK